MNVLLNKNIYTDKGKMLYNNYRLLVEYGNICTSSGAE